MPTTTKQRSAPTAISSANAHVTADAQEIRTLIREAEAVSDDLIQTCAKLKIAMLRARRNPAVKTATGQAALMRLADAENQALGLSTSLFRVHNSLSGVARETAGIDDDTPTEIPASAIAGN